MAKVMDFKFDENLTNKLRGFMVSQSGRKQTYYDWFCGQTDLENMKRLFMCNYYESEFFNSQGWSQEQYLDWLIDLPRWQEQKMAEMKAKVRAMRAEKNKKKAKINLEADKSDCVTGPIYDDDSKQTYYKW